MRRCAWFAIALLPVAPTWAQVSGSATLLSDDRYHGLSLSDGLPTAQLAVAWDRDDGWYAGTQLTRVRFAYADADWEAQVIPYAGYVRRLDHGWTAETGVQYTWYSRSHRYDSPELYAGIGGDHIHARLAWMHDYFGQGHAWYGEIDGDRPLTGRLRGIVHAGVLRARDGSEYPARDTGEEWRYDLAAGVAIAVSGLDLQATWITNRGSERSYEHCPPWDCGSRSGWMLRISRSW